MEDSLFLDFTSKESDNIPCKKCGKGIMIPAHPESEINHYFYCNHCGASIHIDPVVIVE